MEFKPIEIPSFVAEFLATMLFQIIGGVSREGAFGNGMTLAVLIYMTANISGGHLNPAVSWAMFITKNITWKKLILYTISQFLGAIFGALIDGGLEEVAINHEKQIGPGCMSYKGYVIDRLSKDPVTSDSAIFGWEFMMTFILVSVIFAVAVEAPPQFAPIAPFAIGFSLFACANAGGVYTGGALNPARQFGPAVVYGCALSKTHLYWFGEYLGATVAAFVWTVMHRQQLRHSLYQKSAQPKSEFTQLEEVTPSN
eukprot:Colp12_sorted_trinity150504_noHs@29419